MEIKFLLEDIFRTVLVLVRVSAIFAILPIFGQRSVPANVKIVLSAVLSFVIASGLRNGNEVAIHSGLQFVLLAGREVMIGLTFGFLASLIFRAVELGGEIIGTQMGFAIANVYDPLTERQLSVISNFQRVLLILLFFSVNGHHIVISAIYRSYEVLPLGQMGLNLMAAREVLTISGRIFGIAVQLASPAIIMLLLTHVALGVIGRTVPQMNVFIIGFPLTIAIGVFMLAITLPAFINMLQTLIGNLSGDFAVVMRALA
jgi:flagellar biosynthetic protein FliR